MGNALILGCSHAAGYEITVQDPHLFSFPSVIAKKLGYKIINRSIPGGSNDAMFRIFEAEYTKLNSDDIIIACWTGVNRTEFLDEERKEWLTVNLGSNLSKKYDQAFKGWILTQSNEQFGRLNKIKNILALNSIAVEKNLPVINVHSFWPTTDFIWPALVNWPIGNDNLWDWALENKFQKTEHGHFDESAHAAFAEYILSKL